MQLDFGDGLLEIGERRIGGNDGLLRLHLFKLLLYLLDRVVHANRVASECLGSRRELRGALQITQGVAVRVGRELTGLFIEFGFLLSLIVAFVYFLFIIIADTLRNNPSAHPELLVWLPNVLFIAIGGWLFFRLSRR